MLMQSNGMLNAEANSSLDAALNRSRDEPGESCGLNCCCRNCSSGISGCLLAAYYFAMTFIFVPISCIFIMPFIYISLLFSTEWYNYLENKLCTMVNWYWVSCAASCGMTVHEYGADLKKLSERRCLLLANHLSLVDHFVLMLGLHNKGTLPGRWMWVIYNMWKYTFMGIMWQIHGNFFINGGAAKREQLLAQFKDHITSYYHKYDYSWIIMYPEGSRLYLIQKSNAEFAKKNGLTAYEHCAFPRTGAAYAVLNVLGPKKETPDIARCHSGGPIEFIIDATIGYKKGKVPSISGAMTGCWPLAGSENISVHWDVIPVQPEWSYNEKAFKEFLYEQYAKKDKLLKYYYENGKFEGESHSVNTLERAHIFGAQAIWTALSYFVITYMAWPLTTLLIGLIF